MTEEALRVALVGVLGNDSVVQALCGRVTNIVVPRAMPGEAPPLPILVYEIPSLDENTDLAECRLTALATGETAGTTARALRDAALAAITQPAFEAQGVDVVPLRLVLLSVPEGDRLGTPDIEQSDASLQLMVFD